NTNGHFFFPAEDGIRDFHVTGVQTCALPISRVSFEQAVELNPREPEYYSFLAWATYLSEGQAPAVRAQAALRVLKKALSLNPYRSEERRVGQECRSQ